MAKSKLAVVAYISYKDNPINITILGLTLELKNNLFFLCAFHHSLWYNFLE